MPAPRTEHNDEILDGLKAGINQNIPKDTLAKELSEKYSVSERTIRRRYDEVKAESLTPPKDGKGEKGKETSKVKEGGELGSVTQPVSGAIVFTFAQHRIPLNPKHLYDAYLYYEDIALRHDIDEEFSEAIKDCVKHVWEELNHRKAETEKATITIEE